MIGSEINKADDDNILMGLNVVYLDWEILYKVAALEPWLHS